MLPAKSSSRTARWIRPAKRFPDAFSVLLLCFGLSKLFPNKPEFNQYQLGYLNPDVSIRWIVWSVRSCWFAARRLSRWAGWTRRSLCTGKISTGVIASSRRDGEFTIILGRRSSIIKAAAPAQAVQDHLWVPSRDDSFHRKHYRQKYNIFVNGAVYAGVGLKLLLSCSRTGLSPFVQQR